jgi:hypothetical protein
MPAMSVPKATNVTVASPQINPQMHNLALAGEVTKTPEEAKHGL